MSSPMSINNGYSNSTTQQSPEHQQPPPQCHEGDADGGDDDDDDERTQQIESLEQALALQIQKRIEAETIVKTSIAKNARVKASLKDLQELTDDFVVEVDALDGDESEEKMDRRDVLWMLKEVNVRVNDVLPSDYDDDDDNNDGQDVARKNGNAKDIQEERNIAILQGHIVQLMETNQRLRQQQTNGNGMNASPHHSKSKSPPKDIVKQYRMLKDKHTRLEQRHGNIMKEMQECLNTKNQEIAKLRSDLEQVHINMNSNMKLPDARPEDPQDRDQAAPLPQSQLRTPPPAAPSKEYNEPSTPNTANTSTSQQYQKQNQNQSIHPMSPISPFLTSPHKDLQIQSLQEEIEDRNQVIQELSNELDSLVAKTNVQSMEADKVKIRYLESIIKDLEGKLHVEQVKSKATKDRTCSLSNASTNGNGNGSLANSGRCQSNGLEDARNERDSPSVRVSSPKYGSMGWDMNMGSMGWGSSYSSLGEDKKSLAPGAVQSSMMEDLELQIAELMERLNCAEQENLMLKNEMRRRRSSGGGSTKQVGVSVPLESTQTVQ